MLAVLFILSMISIGAALIVVGAHLLFGIGVAVLVAGVLLLAGGIFLRSRMVAVNADQ